MDLIELLKKLNLLKEVPRVGWVLAGIDHRSAEDVAQHTFEVAALCTILGEELKKCGVRVDAERAALMATIHDWSEALTADIPYPAHKYLGGKDTKDHLNSGAATELLAQYPNLLSVWREYHEGKTAEAKLVRASDYLSMLLQYLAYLERGYNSAELEDLWKAVKDDLAPFAAEFPPLRELVDELEKLRKDRIGGSRR